MAVMRAKRGVNRAKVTDAQIMRFILEFRRDRGFSPTLREMVEGLNMSSTSVVTYRIDALADQGLLTRNPMITRSIVPTEAGERYAA
jgi:repressor LexA